MQKARVLLLNPFNGGTIKWKGCDCLEFASGEVIKNFEQYLRENEKSQHTIEKYVRDVRVFLQWCGQSQISKTLVLAYKTVLTEKYAPVSVNSILSSLNCFFDLYHLNHCRVKSLKIQRRIFVDRERELSKEEYEHLLQTAKKLKQEKLYYLMQTLCACGIRVSELCYITKKAVQSGVATISCKGKYRRVLLPKTLCRMLTKYMKKQRIQQGSVFISRTGKPLDRSNVWKMLKSLCLKAGVDSKKVFPHNLRHLFAKTYYSLHRDIVRLADILGHTSIQTTRIYTMETGDTHARQIESLGLLLC